VGGLIFIKQLIERRKMKKIEYQAPEMEVVKFIHKDNLLLNTSSDETPGIGGEGVEGEEAG
jgi:hypothetical protein